MRALARVLVILLLLFALAGVAAAALDAVGSRSYSTHIEQRYRYCDANPYAEVCR